MNITEAKYMWIYEKDGSTKLRTSILATIDGKEYSVPLDEGNTHYAKIKRQVDAGELTIEDAD